MTPGTLVRVGPNNLPGTVQDVTALKVYVEFEDWRIPAAWIDAENVEVREVEQVGQEGLL